ncbi:hypothetical protein ACTMU2_12140 [Cupriavidus basilensis]
MLLKLLVRRDEAEHRLYELIEEGLNSGEGTEYERVEEFAAEFRARLKKTARAEWHYA